MTPWPPPPRLSARGSKAHGLGNDYLVFEAGAGWLASPEAVRRVCDRFRGVGSDGVVALMKTEVMGEEASVHLRMFNPDGSEFERSGNGLRVLAAHVARLHPGVHRVRAHVGGDEVLMTIHSIRGPTFDVSVEMGRAAVAAAAIGLDAPVLQKSLPELHWVPVSVGNPHLVVLEEGGVEVPVDDETLHRVGPALKGHPALEAGANVQIARVVGPGQAEARIWERGVGPTSASGTSACAVAVALVSSGRLEAGRVEVSMPGGDLIVDVSDELDVVLRGPVDEIYEVELRPAFLTSIG